MNRKVNRNFNHRPRYFPGIPVGRTDSFLASALSYEAHQAYLRQLDLEALDPERTTIHIDQLHIHL